MQKFNTLLALVATMLMMFGAQAQTAVNNLPAVPAKNANFKIDYVTKDGRSVPQDLNAPRPEATTQTTLFYPQNSNSDGRFLWNSNARYGITDTLGVDLFGVIFDSLIDVNGVTYDPANYYVQIDTIRFPVRTFKNSPSSVTDSLICQIIDPQTGDVHYEEIIEYTDRIGTDSTLIFEEIYPDTFLCTNSWAFRCFFLAPLQDTMQFLSWYRQGNCPAQGQPNACLVNESSVPFSSFFGLYLNGQRFGQGLYSDCNTNMVADPCEYYYLQDHHVIAVVSLIDRPIQYTATSTPDDGTGSGTVSVTLVDDIPVTYSWFSIDGNNSNLPSTPNLTGLNADRIILGIAPDGISCGGEGILDTVEIASNVSIEDFNNVGISSINAYPNPNSGSLTVDMEFDGREDVRIQVLSVTGKVLFETAASQVERIRQPIELGDVAAGVYMLNVTTSRGSAAQRILVN